MAICYDMVRHDAGTDIETQLKLGQAEFRYLSQQEPEGTRASKPLSAASRLWIDAEASRFRLITIAATGSHRAIASEKVRVVHRRETFKLLRCLLY